METRSSHAGGAGAAGPEQEAVCVFSDSINFQNQGILSNLGGQMYTLLLEEEASKNIGTIKTDQRW